MSFLAPTALALALLSIPIVVLYMLKLRRRQMPVSSTLLWQMLLRDRQANTPWQRLKRNLFLFLQLLILAALVVALARPAIEVPTVASGSAVILLDASASMNAVDVAPSRFDAARAAARGLVDSLPDAARVTLIVAGPQPRTLASGENDKAALHAALDAARPTQAAANWEAAFALAAGALGSAGEQASVVVISDGGTPSTGLPPLPGDVRYIPIGQSGDNVAISALASRPAPGGSELFASVTNYSAAPRAAIISFYLDDVFFSSQPLDLPASQSVDVVLSGLPVDGVRYEARLSSPDRPDRPLDALPLDDAAFAVQPASSKRSVLLITESNLFLEQLLAALPGVAPYRALPAADGSFQIPATPFDLYVFDGIIPGDLPAADVLLVNPPPNPLVAVGGVFTETTGAQVADHPLTRFVDWSDVHILRARQFERPIWADTLVSVESGPLVLAGETGGRHVAVIAFDLHESDLPLQVSYPILLSNLVNYLAPAQAFDAPDGLRPGDSLAILPDLEVNQVAITAPSDQTYSLGSGENGVLFSDTSEVGIYEVRYESASGQAVDYFAVNVFDPAESNIRPATNIQVGRSKVAASGATEVGRRELWPWLAATALAVLMLEWWLYHRRQSPTGHGLLFTAEARRTLSKFRISASRQ